MFVSTAACLCCRTRRDGWPSRVSFADVPEKTPSEALALPTGRDDEALASLKRVHGSHTNERVVMLEFEEIREQIAWERENVSANFLDLFKTWPALHRTLCGCLVQICCQWTGVNVAS